MISALFLIARYWDETGHQGPSNALDTIHAYEVITAVADEFRSSPTLASAGDVTYYNNGDPGSETWPNAVEQFGGKMGRPLIVELTVITGLTDRTVIRYNPNAAEAAALIKARLDAAIVPLPGAWAIDLEEDATIPVDCTGIRVAIGSTGGVLGGVAGWLGSEGFLTTWTNALTLGVYDWLVLPVE